jgi:hypothetical protein
MAMRLIDTCASFQEKSGRLVVDMMVSNALVDLFPEFTGTLERYHPSRPQYHGITGGGITPPAFSFFLDAKFSESTDQNILAGCQGTLHDLQQHLNGIGGLFLRKTVAFGYRLDYFGLCQCHGSHSPVRSSKVF